MNLIQAFVQARYYQAVHVRHLSLKKEKIWCRFYCIWAFNPLIKSNMLHLAIEAIPTKFDSASYTISIYIK
jgi:hypothetical protein